VLRSVALVKTEVSEVRSASIIRVMENYVGAKFLRIVGSYKSHTAKHPRRRDSPSNM
jgi:hypothetical protein